MVFQSALVNHVSSYIYLPIPTFNRAANLLGFCVVFGGGLVVVWIFCLVLLLNFVVLGFVVV